MIQAFFTNLYSVIAGRTFEDASADEVAHICYGYRHLLLLAFTAPWAANVYGGTVEFSNNFCRTTGLLAQKLDQEMDLRDRVRNVVYLMDNIVFQYNEEFYEVAGNATIEILFPNNTDELEIPCESPDVCKLLCYCYYFQGSERTQQKAGEIIRNWVAGMSEGSFWPELPLNEALQRLEAMSMFSDIINVRLFLDVLLHAVDHYAAESGIEKEVRFLPLVSQLGLFERYRPLMDRIVASVAEGNIGQDQDKRMAEYVIRQQIPEDSRKPESFETNIIRAVQFHVMAQYLYNVSEE
jgi:hypothetical protein